MLKFAKEAMEYYESISNMVNATKYIFSSLICIKTIFLRVAFVRLENMYYLHDQTLSNLRQSALEKGRNIQNEFYETENTKDLIFKLATMVYRYSEDKNKIRAILYQTYHHW